jgi:hypothetical protein
MNAPFQMPVPKYHIVRRVSSDSWGLGKNKKIFLTTNKFVVESQGFFGLLFLSFGAGKDRG